MTISVLSVISPNTVSARVTGTDASDVPSSVTANKLVDTANSFSNVSIGDYVVLKDNPKVFTTVTALDSATQLSLDDDIITSTSDGYFVVTAADAFKVVQDGTSYNFDVLVSRGDLVDSEDTNDISLTLSGCRVVSVDSPTQFTVDLPMGGYETIAIALQNQPVDCLDVNHIDVFWGNAADEEILLTSLAGDNYSIGFYPSGQPPFAPTTAIILSDIEDAIVEAIGGGYRTNVPINQRALGAQSFG